MKQTLKFVLTSFSGEKTTEIAEGQEYNCEIFLLTTTTQKMYFFICLFFFFLLHIHLINSAYSLLCLVCFEIIAKVSIFSAVFCSQSQVSVQNN